MEPNHAHKIAVQAIQAVLKHHIGLIDALNPSLGNIFAPNLPLIICFRAHVAENRLILCIAFSEVEIVTPVRRDG